LADPPGEKIGHTANWDILAVFCQNVDV